MSWFIPSFIVHRHPAVRVLLTTLLVLALLAALVATTGALYLHHQLSNRVERIGGVFDGLEDRPAQPSEGPAAEAVNILLIGSAGEPATSSDDSLRWLPGQSADTVMVLHIAGDRRAVSVISIPQDALIDSPGGPDDVTVEDAVSGDTPATAIRTVERITDVRMDHLAVLDWTGLQDVGIEAGVTLGSPMELRDPTRQQALIEQLVSGVLASSSNRDLMDLREQLETIAGHLSVDEDWSTTDMLGLAMSLRGIQGTDVDYFSAPVHRDGDGEPGRLDERAGRRLWAAVREDADVQDRGRIPG